MLDGFMGVLICLGDFVVDWIEFVVSSDLVGFGL